MSYNGYYYSPYYGQAQQPSQTNNDAHYDGQTNRNTSYYSSSSQQLPSLTGRQSPTVPVSSSYSASPVYPYTNYTRQETSSNQPQRDPHDQGRRDSTGYPATSRATKNDLSGLGSLAYASGLGRKSPKVGTTGKPYTGYETSASVSSNLYNQPPRTHSRNATQAPQTYSPHYETAQQAPEPTDESSSQYVYKDQSRTGLPAYNPQPTAPYSSRPASTNNPASYGGDHPTYTQASSGTGDHQTYGNTTYESRPSTYETSSGTHNHNQSAQDGSEKSVPKVTKSQLKQQSSKRPRPSNNKRAERAAIAETATANTSTGSTRSSAPQDLPAIQTTIPIPTNTRSISSVRPQQDTSNRAASSRQEFQQVHQEKEANPPTIDPSQVFNQYEYQRRREAAEAEARASREAREAIEARDAAQKAEQSARPTFPIGMNANLVTASVEAGPEHLLEKSVTPTTTGPRKDDSSSEIKALFGSMFGQMRELKASNPTLFSEIWEEFKKGQPPVRASSQRPPNGSGASTSAAQIMAVSQAMISPTMPSPSLVSPDSLPNLNNVLPSAPEENSTPEQSVENLLDLGKFPAQRRRRKTKAEAQRALQEVTAAVSTEIEQQVDLARDDAISGLAKLQAARATETSQGEDLVGVSGASATDRDAQMRQALLESNTSVPTKMRPAAGMDKQRFYNATGSIAEIPDSGGHNNTNGPNTSRSASKVASGTYWPESSRRDIAVAAMNALLSDPRNNSKQLTVEEIMDVLHQEPSYVQLCEQLEGKGFMLDRRKLAQQLLQAVPRNARVPSAMSKTATNQIQPTTASMTALNTSQQSPRWPAPPQPHMSSMGTNEPLNATNSTYHDWQGSVAPEYAPSMDLPNTPTVKPEISDVPAQPISKADAARKRTFNDLVDLSKEDSEDERIKRVKLMELESSRQNQTSQPPYSSEVVQNILPLQNLQIPSKMPTAASKMQEAGLAAREQLKLATDLAQPLKRNGKKFRIYPKTLARDILISAGRHETHAPLNFHLFPLRDTFKSITNLSDLNTIRWDLLDPGGPPPGSGAIEPPPPENKETDDADDEADAEDTISFEAPDRSDVGLKPRAPYLHAPSTTTFPKPTNPPSTYPSGKRRGRPPRNSGVRPEISETSDLPRPPLTPSAVRTTSASFTPVNKSNTISPSIERVRQFRRASKENDSKVDAMDISRLDAGQPVKWQDARETFSSGLSVQVASKTSTPNLISGVKRRGRPPGALNKKTLDARTPGSSPDQPKRRGRPPGSGTKPPRFSRLRYSLNPDDGIQIPIAKSTPDKDVHIPTYPASRDPNSNPPFSGRNENRTEPVQSSDPIFHVYKCEWSGCNTQLHNLDTLRKHATKMHARVDASGSFPCNWHGCKQNNSNNNKDDERQGFVSPVEWKRHVENEHLQPIAWRFGDGPSAHNSDAENVDYLSDSHGRPITPRIVPEPPPLVVLPRSKNSRDDEDDDDDDDDLMHPVAASPIVAQRIHADRNRNTTAGASGSPASSRGGGIAVVIPMAGSRRGSGGGVGGVGGVGTTSSMRAIGGGDGADDKDEDGEVGVDDVDGDVDMMDVAGDVLDHRGYGDGMDVGYGD
ncbi:hypothetical protein MMC25_003525 [Agyrium rufum]|nr:hypothetical protein [Agyrium rufum]